MISRNENRLMVSGDVTMDTVSALFKEGFLQKNESLHGDYVIDFSKLEKVDSSTVSLMLAWLREAQKNSVNISFSNLPENLKSLAKLYGVADMIPVT